MNWQNLYRQEDAQSAFLNFQRNTMKSFNACCPIKNVKIKYRNRHDWISKDIKIDIKKKERLYLLSAQQPSDEHIKNYKLFVTKYFPNNVWLKENITKTNLRYTLYKAIPHTKLRIFRNP